MSDRRCPQFLALAQEPGIAQTRNFGHLRLGILLYTKPQPFFGMVLNSNELRRANQRPVRPGNRSRGRRLPPGRRSPARSPHSPRPKSESHGCHRSAESDHPALEFARSLTRIPPSSPAGTIENSPAFQRREPKSKSRPVKDGEMVWEGTTWERGLGKGTSERVWEGTTSVVPSKARNMLGF